LTHITRWHFDHFLFLWRVPFPTFRRNLLPPSSVLNLTAVVRSGQSRGFLCLYRGSGGLPVSTKVTVPTEFDWRWWLHTVHNTGNRINVKKDPFLSYISVCFIPPLNLPKLWSCSGVLQSDFKTKNEAVVINYLEVSFVVYPTTPSLIHDIWCRILVWLMKDKLTTIWKETLLLATE
jgi:hypothetical protein